MLERVEHTCANVVYPPVTDTGWVTDAVREAVQASKELLHIAQPTSPT
jgi:3-oxoacyl-[acyl-carrier protein] reductase